MAAVFAAWGSDDQISGFGDGADTTHQHIAVRAAKQPDSLL